MNRYTLAIVLILPSILVGCCTVADRGVKAISMSPFLIALPIAQSIVSVTNFWIRFDFAMLASAVFWIGLVIGAQYSYSRLPKNALFGTTAALGLINAIFVPWSVNSLAWYA